MKRQGIERADNQGSRRWLLCRPGFRVPGEREVLDLGDACTLRDLVAQLHIGDPEFGRENLQRLKVSEAARYPAAHAAPASARQRQHKSTRSCRTRCVVLVLIDICVKHHAIHGDASASHAGRALAAVRNPDHDFAADGLGRGRQGGNSPQRKGQVVGARGLQADV